MKSLASVAPLTGLQHVKRIRKPQGAGAATGKLQILLCPVKPTEDSAHQALGPMSCRGEASLAPELSGNQNEMDVLEAIGEGTERSSPCETIPKVVQRVLDEYGLQPVIVQVRIFHSEKSSPLVNPHIISYILMNYAGSSCSLDLRACNRS